MALGFYSNNKDCYGCKTCSMACMTTRLSGQTATFLRRVDVILDGEAEAQSFLSLACNHCDEPACLANCPVGAYTKLDNGVVVQDHDLCIGCKTCISACPYGAPVFDEASSTTYKCDMCIDRLERGEKPACVEACPAATSSRARSTRFGEGPSRRREGDRWHHGLGQRDEAERAHLRGSKIA